MAWEGIETVTVADDWRKVDAAFERLDQDEWPKLRLAVAAMRKLAQMVRHDAAFADVHPMVSLVSLVFSRERGQRAVDVGWHEGDVIRVLREYLDRVGET